jgi:hypothetical protein
MINKREQGKKNRINGKAFELKVRKDLENKGWIVDRWSNNVDLKTNKLIPAKHTFNPVTRAMSAGNGFPDFIIFKKIKIDDWVYSWEVQLIECKINGYLTKEEKEKMAWYTENSHIKASCFVAKKEGKEIVYEQM